MKRKIPREEKRRKRARGKKSPGIWEPSRPFKAGDRVLVNYTAGRSKSKSTPHSEVYELDSEGVFRPVNPASESIKRNFRNFKNAAVRLE